MRLTTARISEHPWMTVPSPLPSNVNSSVNNSAPASPVVVEDAGLSPSSAAATNGGPSRIGAPPSGARVYAVVAVPRASVTVNAAADTTLPRQPQQQQQRSSAASNVARIERSLVATPTLVVDAGLSQNNSARSRPGSGGNDRALAATAASAAGARLAPGAGAEVRLDRARNTTRLNVLLTGGKVSNELQTGNNRSASTVDEESDEEGVTGAIAVVDWDTRNRSNNNVTRSSSCSVRRSSG